MIRRIPQNKTWIGPYPGENAGNLWATFNVDLDRNEGYIGLSRRMLITSDSNDTALGPTYNASIIHGFIRTDADCNDRYWALNATDLLKTDTVTAGNLIPRVTFDWDTDGLDSSPSGALSFDVFGKDSRADSGRDKLFVTNDTDVCVLNDTGNSQWTGNWWTGKHSQPPLDSNDSYHATAYLAFRKIGLIGDGNKIHTVSRPSDTQNDTVTYARLRLPQQYKVRYILPTSNRAWILAENKFGSQGAVFEWDGFSETYNGIHNIQHYIPISGVNYREVPIIVNGNGQFLEFTGQGFSPMTRGGQMIAFPSEGLNSPIARFSPASGDVESAIAPRGMTLGTNGLIYLNVGFADYSPASLRRRGGIWCLNPITGRLYNKHSLSVADTTTDSTDFGQQAATEPGGIFWTELHNAPLVAGGTVRGPGDATRRGIWNIEDAFSEAQRIGRGHFTTQWIHADSVLEFWDQLLIRFKRFKSSSGDSIIIKARGTRPLVDQYGNPLDVTGTWLNSTTIDVTLNANDDPIAIGDEVEILRGGNAGLSAHILSITGSHGALQDVVIDATMPASSSTGNALVHFERWKKIGTITDTNTYHKMMNIGIDSSFIQFKIELRGYYKEMEVTDMTISSKPSLNS